MPNRNALLAIAAALTVVIGGWDLAQIADRLTDGAAQVRALRPGEETLRPVIRAVALSTPPVAAASPAEAPPAAPQAARSVRKKRARAESIRLVIEPASPDDDDEIKVPEEF
jgi:hypothetical protein